MRKQIAVLMLILSLLSGTAASEAQAPAAAQPEAVFFDDAVFVGDSITNQFQRFHATRNKAGEPVLGGARFLSAGAYSLYLASLEKLQKDGAALKYRGKSVTVPQGLKAMEAGKVFILLGMTDAPGRNPDQDMYRYKKMVGLIQEAVPGIRVIALSVTPVAEKAQTYQTNQRCINLFNERLEALCAELGITYLDIATPLKNEQGFLNLDYSNDKKLHLNTTGLTIVSNTLHDFAREQLEPLP